MNSVFLEVIMKAQDLQAAQFSGRDEIEEPLHEALERAAVGEVTGGGGGDGVAIVDVELFCTEEHFVRCLGLIRDTLRAVGVPRSTVIKRYAPQELEFAVYD